MMHTIDLDTDPFLPDGWSVLNHRKGGQLTYPSDRIVSYLDEGQKEKRMEGERLLKVMEGQRALNANLLDWLLRPEHQSLIPETWANHGVFFWGTLYRNPDTGPFVRCLYRIGGLWRWGGGRLDGLWGDDSPAAVLID